MPYRVGDSLRLTPTEGARIRAESIANEKAYADASPEAQQKIYQARVESLWHANSAFDSDIASLFRPSPPGETILACPPEADVDRESILRQGDSSSRDSAGSSTPAHAPERLYMVSRLDGPSPEIAMSEAWWTKPSKRNAKA